MGGTAATPERERAARPQPMSSAATLERERAVALPQAKQKRMLRNVGATPLKIDYKTKVLRVDGWVRPAQRMPPSFIEIDDVFIQWRTKILHAQNTE